MRGAKNILGRSALARIAHLLMWVLALFVPFSTLGALETDSDGYYLIGSAEDFVEFGRIVNKGVESKSKGSPDAVTPCTLSYKGKLISDIDMSDIDTFRPIGLGYASDTVYMKAIGLDANRRPIRVSVTDTKMAVGWKIKMNMDFDGGGHTISNLTIRGEQIDTVITKTRTVGLGLFCILSSESVVKDLVIENYNFDVNLQKSFFSNEINLCVGGLAGLIDGGTVKNVSVSGKVKVGGNTEGTGVKLGGLFGYVGPNSNSQEFRNDILLENLHASIQLTNNATSNVEIGSSSINCPSNGGLIGFIIESATNKISLKNLTNGRNSLISFLRSERTFCSKVGGVIGCLEMKNSLYLSISDLNNYGKVGGFDVDAVGGVIGYICHNKNEQKLDNLFNGGDVCGLTAGGIVGVCYSTKLSGCVNMGRVWFDNGYTDNDGRPSACLGGIVGRFLPNELMASTADYLTGCVNAGSVGFETTSSHPQKETDYVSCFVGYYGIANDDKKINTSVDATTSHFLLINNLNLYSQSNQTSFPFGKIDLIGDKLEANLQEEYKIEHNCVNNPDSEECSSSVRNLAVEAWAKELNEKINILSYGVFTDSSFYIPSKYNNYAADSGRAVCLSLEDLVSESMLSNFYSNDAAPDIDASSQFVFKKGCYPLVADGKDNDIAKLAASPVFLAKGERWDSISSGIDVCVDYGAEWSSANGFMSFSVSNGKGAMSIRKGGNDTLIGRIGEAEKRIPVLLYKTLFGGGKGTNDDPYLLKNAEQVAELRDSVNESGNGMKNVYFQLANDIDGVDFRIGETKDKPFKGVLDGDNHTVRVNIDSDGAGGFIGHAENATITNLHIAGTVTGGEVAGGVVGDAVGCVIDTCYNTARITAPIAGGIIGRATGEGNKLTNYCNAGTIVGSKCAGGLIGEFNGRGTLDRFVNGGFVRGIEDDTKVGGIMGSATTSGGILCTNSYNYGSIYVHEDMDGGACMGIGECDKVTLDNFTPTFEFDDQIRNNGHCDVGGTYRKCLRTLPNMTLYDGYEQYAMSDGGKSYPVPYWLSAMEDSMLMATPLRIGDNTYAINVLSEPTVGDESLTYDASILDAEDWRATVMELCGDQKNDVVVRLESESGEKREILISLPKNFFPTCGDGSKENPFCISKAEDFARIDSIIRHLGDDYSFEYVDDEEKNWTIGKHFIVLNDISGVSERIGSETEKFYGDIDGDGHTITLDLSGGNFVALFAATGDGAHIHNMVIEGNVLGANTVASVVGKADANSDDSPILKNVLNKANIECIGNNAGGLCATSEARISSCVNAGNVEGASVVGGIVGYSTSDLDSLINLGWVSTHKANVKNIGGIAGQLSGNSSGLRSLSTCVNSGMVSGEDDNAISNVGGIVGSVEYYDVSECLNISRVKVGMQSSKVGALCGESANLGLSFVDSYYDVQLSGIEQNGSLSASAIQTVDLLNINDGEGHLWQNTFPFFPCFRESGVFEKASQLAISPLVITADNITAVRNGAVLYAPNNGVEWSVAGQGNAVEVYKERDIDNYSKYAMFQTQVGTDTIVATYDGLQKHIVVDVACAPVFEDYNTIPSLNIKACKFYNLRMPYGGDSLITEPGKHVIDVIYPGPSELNIPGQEYNGCDTIRKYCIIINEPRLIEKDFVGCGGISIKDRDGKSHNITCDSVFKYMEDDCDTVVAKVRIIKAKEEDLRLEPGCDSVVYNGFTYKENKDFYETVKSVVCTDCDSIIRHIYITVNHSYDITETLKPQVDSVVYGGKVYKNDTIVTVYDGASSEQCDSVYRVKITVIQPNVQVEDVYSCNQYYHEKTRLWLYSDTIIYDTTYIGTDVNVAVTNIKIHKNTAKDTTYLPDFIGCDGAAYVPRTGRDGVSIIEEFKKDTILTTYIPRDRMCDSVVKMKVIVHPAIKLVVEDTIVSCGPYQLADKLIEKNISINDTIKTADLKCDSVVMSQPYLIINKKEEDVKIVDCSEAKYKYFSGETVSFTESAVFNDTLWSHGCVAKVNFVTVSVANPVDFHFDKVSCEPVVFDGVTYMNSTSFVDTVKSVLGCDSLIRHVSIKVMDQIVKDSIVWGCDSVVIMGEVIKTLVPPISVNVGLASNGVCDSVVKYYVNIKHPSLDTIKHKSCGNFDLKYDDGSVETFDADTIVAEFLKSKYCDCDSIVYHNIIIGQTDYVSKDTAECYEVRFSDTDVMREDGQYSKTYRNSFGCDSVVTYNVRILKPSYNTIDLAGDTKVEYGGVVYSRSKTIDTVLTNANGCDSFLTVRIKIEADLGYPIIVNKFGYVLLCNNNIGNEDYVSYQWFKNGVLVDGATKPFYEESEGNKLAGCYQVNVVNKNGKEFISETYCIDEDRTLVIYPNPAEMGETVYLQYDFTSAERRSVVVNIYSAQGNLIQTFRPSSFPTPVENIRQSGQYFIMIKFTDDTVLDGRFIVR